MKQVPGFPDYFVTEDGSVISYRSKDAIVLKPRFNKRGYPAYVLATDYLGKVERQQFKAHRLVAMLYVPNPNNLPEVNHKDGNKANYHPTNLEWCSREDNMKHAVASGLHDMVSQLGLSYSVVSPDGNVVTFTGLNKFCRENNLFPSPLKEVIDGKRKQHKGWSACQ